MQGLRIGFVLEQTLGHVTHSQNLQAAVKRHPEIDAAFVPVFFEPRDAIDRLPPMRNYTLRAARQVRQGLSGLARKGMPDALLFHTQTVAMLAVGWMKRVPSVLSLDATPLQYDQLGAAYDHRRGPPLVESLKAGVHRRAFSAARHLVAWSRWVADSLRDDYGVPETKISIIYPSLDLSAWRRPKPLLHHDGPLRVLFVGGDFERKGGPLLLEAQHSLGPDALELHLVTGAAIEARPGVHLHRNLKPNSAELKALYHRSDLFCLPTLGDCVPNVLVEAAAAGVPALSTRVGAIPELVRHEETGLLMPPGDGQALLAALRRMIDEPELRLAYGARAQALAAQNFDLERNTETLLGILAGVASAPRI